MYNWKMVVAKQYGTPINEVQMRCCARPFHNRLVWLGYLIFTQATGVQVPVVETYFVTPRPFFCKWQAAPVCRSNHDTADKHRS